MPRPSSLYKTGDVIISGDFCITANLLIEVDRYLHPKGIDLFGELQNALLFFKFDCLTMLG